VRSIALDVSSNVARRQSQLQRERIALSISRYRCRYRARLHAVTVLRARSSIFRDTPRVREYGSPIESILKIDLGRTTRRVFKQFPEGVSSREESQLNRGLRQLEKRIDPLRNQEDASLNVRDIRYSRIVNYTLEGNTESLRQITLSHPLAVPTRDMARYDSKSLSDLKPASVRGITIIRRREPASGKSEKPEARPER
jgi:hypothetical protein